MIVLIFLFMVVGVFIQTSGHPNFDYTCTTADGQERNGVCVSIFNCPEMIKLVYEFGDQIEKYVRSSTCLNYVNDIIVCCKEPSRFGINSISSTHKPINSTNFDLRNILMFQTSTAVPNPKTTVPPTTVTAATATTGTSPAAAITTENVNTISTSPSISSETESSVTEVESSSIAAMTTVTEGESVVTVPKVSINAKKIKGLNKLKKSMEYCENSYIGVQYPYLIQIKPFDHDDFSKYLQPCNGVIIENEYVLTTSQCGYQAESILLKQFNTSDAVSCSTNMECDEPTLELSVETVFHSSKMEDDQSGVALLKLSEPIIYNDYVKPLCLPLNHTRTKKEFQGSLTLIMIKNSTATVCYNNDKWTEEEDSEEITNALCISPKKYSSVWCAVDLGGPLIHVNTDSKKLYLYGLISNFSSDEICKNTNISGILLTSNLIDFIVESII